MPEEALSSIMVFQAPQESHRPCQRWLTAPQFWQTKEVCCLGIGVPKCARAPIKLWQPVSAADADFNILHSSRGQHYRRDGPAFVNDGPHGPPAKAVAKQSLTRRPARPNWPPRDECGNLATMGIAHRLCGFEKATGPLSSTIRSRLKTAPAGFPRAQDLRSA